MSGYLSIKRYTPDYFRVVHLRRHDKLHIQKPPVGAEISEEQGISEYIPVESSTPTEEETGCPRRKPRTSYARAKTAVFEYAICNEWQFFVTLTPDGKNDDYYDIDTFMDHVSHWVRNMRRKDGWQDLKYILVPERFKSGDGWHLHGFFKGIPEGGAVPFNLDDAQSRKHRRKLQALNDEGYLSFPAYSRRFGWATLSPIKDPRKAAGYISKYITKELSSRAEDLGCSLYYPCRGLSRAEDVFKGEAHVVGFPLSRDELDSQRYFNDLASEMPFSHISKYGVFGNCTDVRFSFNESGERFIRVYSSDDERDFLEFVTGVFTRIHLFDNQYGFISEFSPDPDNPFIENTLTIRSGQYEAFV